MQHVQRLVGILPENRASNVGVIVPVILLVLLSPLHAHIISIHVYSSGMGGTAVVIAMGSWVRVLW